ncbi:hypothetical protein B1F79_00280 [Coxiella-like endosymbiont of Rhipicephalus sanguineus]|uniref:hypothetical protein n=1 Tax=Coxiella-like endosymbiont of Rhipicephalus sanguineus TaxID=1955402 RepID=UPI0020402FA7|nr:hypothetical protein [Coxiella-like endosymbiont of Rhipicephalus sanguineus]MBT8506226.1 hypothetical protein [Coxiella-like endosymbiont of Rhipicephalus sanguineus]
MIQHEFYCSFEAGLPGAYFSKRLRRAEKEGRIKDFPISCLPISTFSDIGINQKTGRTAISWWVQRIPSLDKRYRVIYYYENFNEALNHYVKVLEKN